MKRALKTGVLLMTTLMMLCGCGKEVFVPIEPIVEAPKPELRERVYDGSAEAKRVFIQEGDIFAPYLIIGKEIDGEILVLREFILNAKDVYSFKTIAGSGGGYYTDGNLDNFLNTRFLASLSKDLQEMIIETPITVMTEGSIGQDGDHSATEKIDRKVFLLSTAEISYDELETNPEGELIPYFNDVRDLVVTHTNDFEPQPYWTRSANHWSDMQAWSVDKYGTLNESIITNYLGVRPAFNIPADAATTEIFLPYSNEDVDSDEDSVEVGKLPKSEKPELYTKEELELIAIEDQELYEKGMERLREEKRSVGLGIWILDVGFNIRLNEDGQPIDKEGNVSIDVE